MLLGWVPFFAFYTLHRAYKTGHTLSVQLHVMANVQCIS